MRNATLLFLIKRDGNVITDVCLAMKKRGFGVGRYNGAGGKVEAGETIEEAVIRETQEEIGVTVSGIKKCAELEFTFSQKADWNQMVHVYFAEDWIGEPVESEEMNPKWFAVADIPYDTMWPDDIFWLPEALAGKFVNGAFTFGEGDVIEKQEVKTS